VRQSQEKYVTQNGVFLINSIMKSTEFLIEKKTRKPKEVTKGALDWEETPDHSEDPESDSVPHIIMQLRKALDTDGDYSVKFKDGTKHQIPLSVTRRFLQKYLSLKPNDREEMQNMAIKDLEHFKKALHQHYSPLSEPSIYDR